MYGINEKVYKNLINYFTNNTEIKKVILFGSRAKGMANFNSDIDLCVNYLGVNKGSIVEDIDELIGIYSCDIVFENSLNEEIRNQIDSHGVEIYKKV
ncbi:nucleotidyltransferase family protein [Clostridium grantii]|uniref:Nucleotidyltransferase domain-containing protein n=1 Tax=Clostridium grantii DSM 8605 TaxID=1121316 RepID=A0A1M5R008_9CLOT|nr:nucleotidyltransferase domain-containing protein [Clostridium grantii]SHH19309.1 Nucleotidyltransferase domain-containing protein [Clostridium grantii DSM 8605]